MSVKTVSNVVNDYEFVSQATRDKVDQAIAELGGHVTAAITLLRGGHALPGPDAQEEHNDFRIALPSSPAAYLQLKNGAFMRAFGGFARVWGCR